MARTKISFVAVSFLAAILFAWAPSTANAGNNAAVVINDNGCDMLNGNGQIVFTGNNHRVGTFSENDNSIEWCKGIGLSHPGGPAVIFQGPGHNNGKAITLELTCDTSFGLTENWFNVVAPSGKAILVCIVHGGA